MKFIKKLDMNESCDYRQVLDEIIAKLTKKNNAISKLELKFIKDLKKLKEKDISMDADYDDCDEVEYAEVLASHVLWDLERLGYISDRPSDLDLDKVINILNKEKNSTAKLELKFIEDLKKLEEKDLSLDDDYDEWTDEQHNEMLGFYVLEDLVRLGQMTGRCYPVRRL